MRDAYSTAGIAGKQKVYTMYVTFISKQKHKNQKSGALGFHHSLVALVAYVVGVHVNYVSYVDAWAVLSLIALANKQKPETPC